MSIYDNNQVIKQYTDLITDNSQVHEKLIDRIISKINHIGNIGYHRILDIGCGLSPLLPTLIDKLSDNISDKPIIYYQGIDSSIQMIKNATNLTKHLISPTIQIEYKVCDATTLNQQEEFSWYNIVIIQNFVHLVLDQINLMNLWILYNK